MNTTATRSPADIVSVLTARELDDVITGRNRLGDSPAEQLAIWNAAIDRENGYTL